MPITALPSLDRTSATFKTDVDTFFGTKIPTFSVEAEAARVEINNNTSTATAAASTATTQVGLAANQAQGAALSASLAQQAALSAGSIAWVSGTTYAVGDLRYSPLDYQNYRRKTAGAGTVDPSLDLTNWAKAVDAGVSLIRSAHTSNTVLGASDKGKLVDITSGTFTQTFVASATLGDGWYCYLKNSGTGDITLDPNSSELIDGLTSYVMYPGEVRLVQCDGSAFRSVVLNSFYRVFTVSSTFTTPPGYTLFAGLLWGGGGSGSVRNDTGPLGGGGGGGGACVPLSMTSSTIGSSVVCTIGAGGVAKVNDGAGNTGGNTSFGALITAYGGAGGASSSTGGGGGGGGGALSAGVGTDGGEPSKSAIGNRSDSGFGGGGGSTGSINTGKSAYGGGGGGAGSATASYAVGGNSVFGGAGGGGVLTSSGAAGGISVHGGAGGAGAYTAGATVTATAGFTPGGGGRRGVLSN